MTTCTVITMKLTLQKLDGTGIGYRYRYRIVQYRYRPVAPRNKCIARSLLRRGHGWTVWITVPCMVTTGSVPVG